MIFRRRQRKKPFWRRRWKILLLLTLFTAIFVIWPVYNIQKQARKVASSARTVKESIKQNDITLVKNSVADFQNQFGGFSREAKKIYWLRFIPIAGGNVADLKNGVEAG